MRPMPPSLPDGRRVGAHLPLAAGMVAAVERAHTIGARALQVFADNPTAWRRRAEPAAELPAFRDRARALDIGPIAIHASYLVNLAGPEDEFRARSIEVLASELRAAPGYDARFVNVHIGSHKGTGLDGGLERFGRGVASVLAEVDSGADAAFLVLENSAGGGGGIGVSIDELEAVLEAIAAHGADTDRIRLCLDIAHLWAAGVPIGDPEAVDGFLTALEARIGRDRLAMIHLNDSKAPFGGRMDRHEHLGAGLIGVPALQRLLTDPRLAGVTYYLETPGMEEGYDAINVARAYAIAAGRRLTALPRGATKVRGTRSRIGSKAAAG